MLHSMSTHQWETIRGKLRWGTGEYYKLLGDPIARAPVLDCEQLVCTVKELLSELENLQADYDSIKDELKALQDDY